MGEAALSGIRVLDLSQFEAGPSCTELLAWLGADVVKVERPRVGDQGRSLGGLPGGLDSTYFVFLNANKRSVTLDLAQERGRELFRRMLPSFDVLVENYTLGTMERWGLGWEALSGAHPVLIYASVRGFGDSGPYASFKAFDPVAQAMGGAMSVNGERGAPPLRLGLTLGDTGAGVHCALGIVSAYVQRLRTGRGQRVEISMQEAVVNFARTVIAGAKRTGKPSRRDGSRIAIMAPSDLYPCAPGGENDYAYIIVSTGAMLDRLLLTVGRPDLAGRPAPQDRKERRRFNEELRSAIAEWTGERDKFAVMETLEGNGVPCGAVLDTSELLANPHLRERGLISTLDHPTLGRIEVPGSPVRLSSSSVDLTPAPLLGQHNREVYAELLDLGEADLAELTEAGVI